MSAQKKTLEKKSSTKISDKVDEHNVAQYLKGHPEFFQRHTSLLGSMSLEHNSGTAVSLIERQISILREQKKRRMREKTLRRITLHKNTCPRIKQQEHFRLQ